MNDNESLRDYVERFRNRGKYQEPELTPDQIEKIRRYGDKVKTKPVEGILNYDVKNIFQIMKNHSESLGTEFLYDDSNKQYIDRLCDYFSTLLRDKGLMIRGSYGVGKTYPLSLLAGLKQTFKAANIINCKEIKRGVSISGMDSIDRLFSKFMDKEVLVLDELNEDWKVNYMGTVLNPVEMILLHRYDLYQRYGTITHITTNLNGKQVEEFYGGRVRSRLREMCEDIVLLGNDRRK